MVLSCCCSDVLLSKTDFRKKSSSMASTREIYGDI